MKAGAPIVLRLCRLVGASDGAHYMGLGETSFRERYDHLAKWQGGRLVWDIRDLDAEADKLPYARPKVDPGAGMNGTDSMADWKP
jgi:hypothetical protein